MHARVIRYDTGPRYDPLRPAETIADDWAILTLTDKIAEEFRPLDIATALPPKGTRLIMAGYPQDRAHLMTADRDCQVLGAAAGGKVLVHDCRGVRGYSGAPLIGADGAASILGIHVATSQSQGTPRMLAIPASGIAPTGPTTPAREPPCLIDLHCDGRTK